MKKILVVVDMQNDFIDGALGTPEAVAIVDNVAEKIRETNLDTDICVISNALLLKSHFPEAKIVVDASCCAGSTPDMHDAALDVMRSCQIDVINDGYFGTNQPNDFGEYD